MKNTVVWTAIFIVGTILFATSINAESVDTDSFNEVSENISNYTVGSNSNITIHVNKENKSYSVDWITRENFTKIGQTPYLGETGAAITVAKFQCRLLQKLAYNHTTLKKQIENDSRKEKRAGVPSKIFKEYTPSQLEGTVYNTDNNEKLTTCNPTKNKIKLKTTKNHGKLVEDYSKPGRCLPPKIQK